MPNNASIAGRLAAAKTALLVTLSTLAWVTAPIAGLAFGSAAPLEAQSSDRGSVALALQLRQLDGVKRVLMIAAHPDDEDTSLLAELARGHGAETAYLSLTRGEGGQNLIGPELFEGLGIVRTGELLAARRLDGGRQFFTRAFDFGYSKRAEEALELWPEEDLLGDVVWAVRKFRPHVIVSVFSGTPRDGHGQHQAAGIMANRVFDAAADPEAYPEHFESGLRPWAASKLYRNAWFSEDASTSAVQTGVYDPLLGRSHFQVAMESRSQHRSQDMGVAQGLGPRSSRLELVRATSVPGEGDGIASLRALDNGGVFAGVDTSIVALASVPGAAGAREPLEAYRVAVGRARQAFDPFDPSETHSALVDAAGYLDAALDALEGEGPTHDVRATLAERRAALSKAAILASGLILDVRASDDLIVPGQLFRLDLELWNGGSETLANANVSVTLPNGAEVTETDPPPPANRFGRSGPPPTPPGPDAEWTSTLEVNVGAIGSGEFERRSYYVRLAEDTPPTELYYLREIRDGARYRWPESSELWGLPRDPDPFQSQLSVESGGEVLTQAGPIRFRGVDRAFGEFSQPVQIVPAISVETDPGVLVWPEGSVDPRNVRITVSSAAPTTQTGTVRLELPAGFRSEPEMYDFELNRPGDEATFVFELLSSGTPATGEHTLKAVAEVGARSYDQTVEVIDYEHIPRTPVYRSAETTVSVFPVRVAAGLRLGYVMGSGDSGPDAIRQLGVEPVMLGETELASADLTEFDVIVLGIRAYQTREDLRRYNERVLQFARDGGTLVVQYNQYNFPTSGVSPFTVDISRPHDRVSVEEAPVTILDPDHPAAAVPNRISNADFEGWVQERGLYFLSEWDDAMTPLLEMNDPGEDPKRGSLLVAPLGQGTYVYTGLAFFRQLPAGVPGAYRLFANLISLKSPGVS